SRSGGGFRLRMDAGARPRAAAWRHAPAGDFRSRRLVRAHDDDHRDWRIRNLGDAWPGGRTGALVPVERPQGAAAPHRWVWRRGRRRCPRWRGGRMNRFAELLDRLAYEPGRNAKLRLITGYLRDTPDPERGWAVAALTGALTFKHAKGGTIRALIAERTDPTLFALSYDYVGDLSETVALMWPADPKRKPNAAPSLSEVVDTLSTLGKAQLPAQIGRWLD